MISREHAEGTGPRGVADRTPRTTCATETTSIMINEEDHLPMQVPARAGLAVDECWSEANAQIDDALAAGG